MNLSFNENLTGYIFPGETNQTDAFNKGKEKNFFCSINGVITAYNVEEFVTITERKATFDGTVTVPGLGEKLSILNGSFNLYKLFYDKEKGVNMKIMEYILPFKSELDESYIFHGKKTIFPHAGSDMLKDSTTLFVDIYKGENLDFTKDNKDKLYATGILHISSVGFFEMLKSTTVTGAKTLADKVKTISQFYDFFFGEAYTMYFQKFSIFYSTDYQNFVLSGSCKDEGKDKKFFFYSGAHDLGFPWGDPNTFWDVSFIMATKDENGNKIFERYLIAARNLEESLKLDVIDGTTSKYSYKGTIYRLSDGYSVSFSDDLLNPAGSKILTPVDADIEFTFDANVPQEKNKPVPAVVVPFGLPEGMENPLLLYIDKVIKEYAPEHKGMGVRLGIRSVSLKTAKMKINKKEILIDINKSWGEAEKSTIKYVKEPSLNYNYFCGISPESKKLLVHTTGGVLFNDTIYPVKNLIDHLLSAIAHPFRSVEVNVDGNELKQIDRKPKTLKIKDDYVLEVNYDHYEPGVFQRRIVLLTDSKGEEMFALEEDMKRINLKAIAPATTTVKTDSPLDNTEATVAVYKTKMAWTKEFQDPAQDTGTASDLLGMLNIFKKKNPGQVSLQERVALENEDKRQLLHQVVQATTFIQSLYERAKKLGKQPKDMKVVIKPNFMFLYGKYDHTTYTDPVLIKELIDIIYDEGFTDITVVEAQSTYGNYFENRGVLNVAKYIGLEACEKYKVVDMSDQSGWVEPIKPFEGPLKGTKIHKVWQDADFRISFAKNKTHCYAYYTLTIKCIYGALPVQNKYHEYHCTRGIYATTIEYLQHYPIHFGFIDAYESADGPFGVFSKKDPNYTRTIIGGDNIVAVDWIGSSKMGLDPLVSEYMKKAVVQFGKPRINLVGDKKDELYDPWVNVPIESTFTMNHVIDLNYQFGNAFTNAMMSTDTEAFPPKDETWWMKAIRFFNAPMRSMVYGNHKNLKQRYDVSGLPPVDPEVLKELTIENT